MTWNGERKRHREAATGLALKDTLRTPMVAQVNTLIEEAKKYKTADGFVKAQGEPLYHGTPFEFDTFKNQTTFFSKNKSFAESIAEEQTDNIINKMESEAGYYPRIMECYGRDLNLWDITNADNFRLLERKLPDKITVMNYYIGGSSVMSKADYLDDLKSTPKHTWGLLEGTARDIIKNEGFDGWKGMEKGRESIGIFDPSKIKTKAQLIDIWNKAHSMVGQ